MRKVIILVLNISYGDEGEGVELGRVWDGRLIWGFFCLKVISFKL